MLDRRNTSASSSYIYLTNARSEKKEGGRKTKLWLYQLNLESIPPGNTGTGSRGRNKHTSQTPGVGRELSGVAFNPSSFVFASYVGRELSGRSGIRVLLAFAASVLVLFFLSLLYSRPHSLCTDWNLDARQSKHT